MSGNSALAGPSTGLSKAGIKDLLTLVKCHLSLYIGLSALTGHVMAQGRLSFESLEMGIWVTLLAMGAGMLNNLQDRFFDQRFSRTRSRILARGAMGPGIAGFISFCLVLTGLLGLLLFYAGPLPFGLGLVSLVLYNGLYTPMKKLGSKTGRPGRWAMVPGTLSGMIPPALGWAGSAEAGADLSGLFIFMTGLGLWQFPHYLVLDLKHAKERKNSPWPGFTRLWSENETLLQVVTWSSLFSLSMTLFLVGGWIHTAVPGITLLILALGLPLLLSFLFFTRPRNRHLDLGFWSLNLAMLLYMALILLDRI